MSFTIKEIIDIAVGMEDAGLRFYNRVADKFKDQHIKDLFLYLARQEVEHRKLFQSLSDKVSDKPGEYNEEYFLYLKALGGDKIYPGAAENIESVMSKIETPLDAVNKGFQDEKEAILFYNEIKRLYENDSETSEVIDRVIMEERKHALKLWDLKESLKKS